MSEAQRGWRSEQSEQTWFSGRVMRTLRRFFISFWSAMVIIVDRDGCKLRTNSRSRKES